MDDATVDRYIDQLKQAFVNPVRHDKAFVLDDRENEDPRNLPNWIAYDPETSNSLWGELQMNLVYPSESTIGSRGHFPELSHSIRKFNRPRGYRSQSLVSEEGLRTLIRYSKEEDVVRAIRTFARQYLVESPIQITREQHSVQGYHDVFGRGGESFYRQLMSLQNFGGLRVRYLGGYLGGGASIDHSAHDRLYPDQRATHRVLPGTSCPDCNFFIDFNRNNGQSDRTSLVTMELKSAAHKVTPGFHSSGRKYCRPGTNDLEIFNRILQEEEASNVERAQKWYQITADQAVQQAVMNKCEVLALSDVAGFLLMSFDGNEIENLDIGIRDRRKVKVKYNRVYCAHWEDGNYLYALFCAIANQLFVKVEGLNDYLLEYSKAVRGGRNPPAYRDIALQREIHQRTNRVYDQFARYHEEHKEDYQRRRLAEEFGTNWTQRNLDDFEVHEVLQEDTDEQPTVVYKISANNVNSGQTFVAKALVPDGEGEQLFFNEVMIYKHLMSISSKAELWPHLLEYGMITIKGCGYYYLGIELLEGEEASEREYEACARSLLKNYGVLHGDLRSSNFMRLKERRKGKKVVKALDFGFSMIAQNSANEPNQLSFDIPENIKVPNKATL